MAGNVWEWMASEYDKNTMVLRGGSWNFSRLSARCSDRSGGHPFFRNFDIGFRCVRT
jgi:formylglycine-generating enzyme required for sulfatase activity